MVYRAAVDTVAAVVAPLFAISNSTLLLQYDSEQLERRSASDTSSIWEHYHKNAGLALHQDTFLQKLTQQVVANTMQLDSIW